MKRKARKTRLLEGRQKMYLDAFRRASPGDRPRRDDFSVHGFMVPPRIVLCVSIDCECDKGAGWRTRVPLSFEGVGAGVVGRLQPLFRRFGAKPTYLLSPEVVRDPACVERFASLEGCELGTHLHGEHAEPESFQPVVTTAVQRDYPRELEQAKLAWLTQAFERAFHRPPRSFRAGRFGIGPNTLTILESLGYRVESSVTPHVDWSQVSPGLSFVGAPTQPYHPDPHDPGRPGGSALFEVPITIRKRSLSCLPWLGPRLEPQWLRPTRSTARVLLAVAREEILDAQSRRPATPVVLHAMLHNVEVVPAASPYAATERAARRILARLASLLDFARKRGIPCVGLGDVPEVVGR